MEKKILEFSESCMASCWASQFLLLVVVVVILLLLSFVKCKKKKKNVAHVE